MTYKQCFGRRRPKVHRPPMSRTVQRGLGRLVRNRFPALLPRVFRPIVSRVPLVMPLRVRRCVNTEH